MFERKTKLQIEELLQTEIDIINLKEGLAIGNRQLRPRQPAPPEPPPVHNDPNMTRKTRTRRPRIHSIQSGYCAVCHIPYNNVEDHIQSKRHQKLIGEDANYISLNGFNLSHDDVNIHSFLNLNGIEGIGVNDTSNEESPRMKTSRNMPRSATRLKPPTNNDGTGHHLRSRRNVNYLTPPLEEDSLQEKPEEEQDKSLKSKQITKLEPTEELWNSGRPKRSCIRTKRISADERLVNDNKSYYKMEVLPTKLRSSVVSGALAPPKPPASSRRRDEKGLIVKLKNLRPQMDNLNTEQNSFLFPNKDDSTSQDDEEDLDDRVNFKVEDEGSMDSLGSNGKGRKKRRTHAELFITDNQKYYKFETPGSRLRYHGSFLSGQALPNTRHNGDSPGKINIKQERLEECNGNKEQDIEEEPRVRDFESYEFSFERSISRTEPRYVAFERQDKGETKYHFYNDSTTPGRLVLPYQMRGPFPPLDPRICIAKYYQTLKAKESASRGGSSTGRSTPNPCTSSSSCSLNLPDADEDSKISAISTTSSSSTLEEKTKTMRYKRRRPELIPVTSNSKNPRKSPRQHASTLAILSNFIQQRKRRSGEKRKVLAPIPEEKKVEVEGPPDVYAQLKEFEDKLEALGEENLDDLPVFDDAIDFKDSKVSVEEILMMCQQPVVKKTNSNRACSRKFLNGLNKPGRRKKKNKTGWPNKNRKWFGGTRRGGAVVVDSEDDLKTLKSTDSSIKTPEKDSDSEQDNRVDKEEDKVTNLSVDDGEEVKEEPDKRVTSPRRNRRTVRKQRRMPGSPKSPRMLRKPRGRWYRER